MRVQLSEKSKAEFIELINKDSITCWFEVDEFVMPSGQGKTAKGIVLGKLLVWQHQQSKVDELQKQVTDLDNRATKYALDAMATAKLNAELQKRVDELQTAFKQLIEMENESISFEHDLFDKGWNQSARQTIENIYKLTGLGEQALKGGGE